jgi:hypothetical protein
MGENQSKEGQMIKRGAGSIGVVVLVWALLASPVMAGQIANDITGMTVEFTGQQTEFGTTFCTYKASVAFTYKGRVRVQVYSREGATGGPPGEYRDFVGSGTAIFEAGLWVPLGTTATFGSTLGQYKQKGPDNYTFVLLDTFEVAEPTTCS